MTTPDNTGPSNAEQAIIDTARQVLTPREFEIWHASIKLDAGHRRVAHTLGIGQWTARDHLRSARKKLAQAADKASA